MLKAKVLLVYSTIFSLPKTPISYSFTCFLKYRALFLLTCLKFAKVKKELSNYFNVITWQIHLLQSGGIPFLMQEIQHVL